MEKDVKNHNTHPHEAHCYDIVSETRKPKFLIEEYIGDNLIDYKFYYVNGKYIFFHEHINCFVENDNSIPPSISGIVVNSS